VVGYNYNGPTLQNCVALNKNVTTTENTSSIGRVIGNNNGATMNNNYGRDNMSVVIQGGSPVIATPNINGKDGDDVTTTNAISPTWWTTTTWNAASLWDWDNTWNYPSGSKLPTLKGMPGNPTQNPVLK